jgi:hypothetical protein
LAHSSGGELPIYLPQEIQRKKKTLDESSLFSGAKFHTILKKIVKIFMIS